jgi:hypothetical protein
MIDSTPPPLYAPENNHRYPPNRRLFELQSPSGRFEVDKNFLLLLGFEKWIVQPVV